MSDTITPKSEGRDFLRAIIEQDLEAGTHGGRVVTRFPPEPNGYLHIGHAKSICLNFGVAAEYGGVANLRFDDTNPLTEDIEFVNSIQDDIRWLGFDWGDSPRFASDYFEQLFGYAVELVEKGLAYVDSQDGDAIRETRGSVTEPGSASPFRERPVEENLDLLRRMRAGEFPDGAHVLRAKIDMDSPNMIMRDPILYRILRAHHYRQGDAWCIYPLYDFAHCLEDSIEGITHSFCTLEFENNREIYDWLLDNLDVPRPQPRQFEFARLNLEYTLLSKRRLLELVNEGHVSGWDDPRMPTVAGMRRRGVPPGAVRAFCDMIGVAKANSRVDIGKLEYAIRDDLNQTAPRVMAVLDPLRLVITNYPEGQVEELEAPYFPHDVGKEGSRTLPFSGELLIERDDFAEVPPKGFHRLSPGVEVRLRYGYVVRCTDVVKDDGGEIIEVHCSYDPETRGGTTPDGRRIKGTLHWVSAAESLPVEVRIYDRLFAVPDPDEVPEGETFLANLNPDSLRVLTESRVERSLAGTGAGTSFQFERQGYFVTDPDGTDDHLVFNRTVTLRDSWAKSRAHTGAPTQPAIEPQPNSAAVTPAESPVTPGPTQAYRPTDGDAAASFDRLVGEGVPEAEAGVLARAPEALAVFEDARSVHDEARLVATWVVNEVPRIAEDRALDALPFSGTDLGELLGLIAEGVVSARSAREVLAVMGSQGGDAATIVAELGLTQMDDADELGRLVDGVLAAFPDKVEDYREGKQGLIGFFVGQAVRESGGKADPKVLRGLLSARLD